jgi:beta-lactamase class A
MRNRGPLSALRLISVFLLLSAMALFTMQFVTFSRTWANFPIGMTIAGVPVERLNRQEAAQRLLEIYSLPVEIHYGEAVIQLDPSVVDFQMNTDSMLAAADQERTRQSFWTAFWSHLWERATTPTSVPLSATFSGSRLRTYLTEEIAKRYDRSPTAAVPATGTVNFLPGQPGAALDIERSMVLIETALRSPAFRSVSLPIQSTTPPRPAFQNLEVLLKQTIEISNFDGVMGLYLLDLQTGQEIHFAYNQGQAVTLPPDVAFTASSTIKIPIMIAVFRRLGENPTDETAQNLKNMIALSKNDASDWLMSHVIDKTLGPLGVSEDMQTLGLNNTFLAGYFASGSPILYLYKTTSNQRTDVSADPDPYNQTTPSEIGQLLADVYECARTGGGSLIAAFPNEITQDECILMDNYLAQDNKTGALIQRGLPDGTRVSHKHGWVTDPATYIIHDMSDAAIVYTPGGNFVLAVYLYHPVQLVFEPTDKLVADLARAAYNFYNLP